MEIKVVFRGKEIGHIDFDIYNAISLFRKYGYASFTIRSQCRFYDYFAQFKNEDAEKVIYLYPNRCLKNNESTLTYNELLLIKYIIDHTKYEMNIEEESE